MKRKNAQQGSSPAWMPNLGSFLTWMHIFPYPAWMCIDERYLPNMDVDALTDRLCLTLGG